MTLLFHTYLELHMKIFSIEVENAFRRGKMRTSCIDVTEKVERMLKRKGCCTFILNVRKRTIFKKADSSPSALDPTRVSSEDFVHKLHKDHAEFKTHPFIYDGSTTSARDECPSLQQCSN